MPRPSEKKAEKKVDKKNKPSSRIVSSSKYNPLYTMFCKIKNLILHSDNSFKFNENISGEEQKLVNNFLKFRGIIVESIMIPRTSIVALPDTVTFEAISEAINKSSLTRIFIYQDNLDNITGFVHIKDLFKLFSKKHSFQLNKIIRKVIITTPNTLLLNLFREMQSRRTHIAIVVDEYGATAGMITIENILEEIFGDIDDEHDPINDKNYKILDSNTVLVNGTTDIKSLEDLLKIKLKKEHDEFDTISGLVLAKAGRVPVKGTRINIADKIELEVIDSTPRTIKKIKLVLHNKSV